MSFSETLGLPQPAVAPMEAGGAQRDWHYYGVLFYVVFFYARLSERIPPLGAMRFELVFGGVLVAESLRRILTGRVRFDESPLNKAAFVFLAVAMITVPFALVKTRALNTFIDFFKFFAIFPLISTALDTVEKLRGFLKVYLTMVALIFLEPFALSLVGKGMIFNNHQMRLAGTTKYFGHPNQLGGITAEHIPFYYYMIRSQRSRIAKLALLAILPVMVRVVMLTQSRTGFLGVLTAVFFIMAFSRRRVLAFGLSLAVLLAMWFFAPPETKSRFMTLGKFEMVMETDRSDFSQEQVLELGSMSNRLTLIRHGLEAFAENPILGLGVGCFISFNGYRYNYWIPPHNTFIQALSEMGLVGSVAFLAVLVCIFRNLRAAWLVLVRIGAERSFLGDVCLATSVYLLARIVVGFFGQDLYANYWWVAGGLSIVVLRVAKAREERFGRPAGADAGGRPARAA